MNIAGLPTLLTRVTAAAPTVDLRSGTADVVVLKGSPISRAYGTERLRLSRSAVITDRLYSCGVALLDSHRTDSIRSALGKITSLRIERGALRAGIKFHQTSEGREAAEMLSSGEIDKISVAYRVADMEVLDADNRLIDPRDTERAEEGGLIFEATRFEVYELSLVRDGDHATDSFADRAYAPPVAPEVANCFARMTARQMMVVDHQERRLGPRRRPEIDISIFHGRQPGGLRSVRLPPGIQHDPPSGR